MLGIKPMILMKDGEIFSSGVARSRKKSIDKLLVQIKEHFVKNNLDASLTNIPSSTVLRVESITSIIAFG